MIFCMFCLLRTMDSDEEGVLFRVYGLEEFLSLLYNLGKGASSIVLDVRTAY